MSMQTVESLSLDLDNREQLLEFLEQEAYVIANHGNMEIKFTHTVNLADRKKISWAKRVLFIAGNSPQQNRS